MGPASPPLSLADHPDPLVKVIPHLWLTPLPTPGAVRPSPAARPIPPPPRADRAASPAPPSPPRSPGSAQSLRRSAPAEARPPMSTCGPSSPIKAVLGHLLCTPQPPRPSPYPLACSNAANHCHGRRRRSPPLPHPRRREPPRGLSDEVRKPLAPVSTSVTLSFVRSRSLKFVAATRAA